ncbi:tyrosyl-tRNA synthetase [Plectosphaerella plurivora]|uniref:Tyrosine--tRNA ligase n=1 Tax=Plectosphaerella plurivora TaxID=936078 RepID=A0A9P8V7R1_9PEZI|nr:tyrosyl-tRNA synthetase [Plectosphaerella plurivora]
MSDLSTEQKLALLKRNLSEVLDQQIIEDVYKQGRDPVIYWGTATTGRPHTGYLVPALKLADFLRAGAHVTVLLADIHGFLDNLKAPIEIVQHRAEFYRFTITALLKAVGVDTSKLRFILGSDYQKTPEYIMDLYKLASITSEHDAKKAGAEVVKQSAAAPLSGLLYPLLQVLDEQYLGADAQFGGVDQRKLFTAAKEWLPKLGYKERAHLMNPMIPSLQGAGAKMSSSEPDSKIDLLDNADAVSKKVKKAVAVPKEADGNGLLAFAEYVLLPASELKHGHPEFRVERTRDNLEDLVFTDIASMTQAYRDDVLTPQLLKPAMTKAINELLAPIQAEFQASKEWQEVTLKAYPPEEKPKKVKKVKDKGSRHPGAGKPAEKNEKPLEGDAAIAQLKISEDQPNDL